jgi:hypothetical protein
VRRAARGGDGREEQRREEREERAVRRARGDFQVKHGRQYSGHALPSERHSGPVSRIFRTQIDEER